MIVDEYINNDFKPLSKEDSAEFALQLFDSYNYNYLPVVEDGMLIACLSSDFDLEIESENKVGDLLDYSELFFVQNNSSLLDALKVSGNSDTNMIPVVGDRNEYLGYVSQGDIMSVFSKSPFFTEMGGVLVVKKSIKEYGVSEVAQIIESENAKILGLFVSEFTGDEVVLTIKINQIRLGVIEASLKRFGYSILESYHENKFNDDMKDRYDALMSYLDV
ncbi:MAG: CBS domain-containing protein [Flavobacteriales bacterium]|nr:CBS domain-containing protein [Flavobacteriales bacterium]